MSSRQDSIHPLMGSHGQLARLKAPLCRSSSSLLSMSRSSASSACCIVYIGRSIAERTNEPHSIYLADSLSLPSNSLFIHRLMMEVTKRFISSTMGSKADPAESFDVEDVLTKLNIDEKIALLSGTDFWHTAAVPRLGVPALRLSDGPNGVRGTRFFNGVPAACLPCGKFTCRG